MNRMFNSQFLSLQVAETFAGTVRGNLLAVRSVPAAHICNICRSGPSWILLRRRHFQGDKLIDLKMNVDTNMLL